MPFCVGAFGTDSFLARPRKKMFPVDSVAIIGMEMVICFWECTFLPLQHVRKLPEFAALMALGRRLRCLLWHGWLPGLSSAGERNPWAASFGDLACCKLECRLGAYPGDTSAFWTPPEYWDADDIALEVSGTPIIWTDGSRRDFSLTGGFEVVGAVVYVPALSLLLRVPFGELQKSMVMLVWSVAVLLCPSLGHCRLFNVLNSGVPSLLCRPTGLVTSVLTTSMLLGQLAGCWIVAVWPNLCL